MGLRTTSAVRSALFRSPRPHSSHLVPRTYVEVGVSTGRSITLALPGTITIGIDPSPELQFPLRRRTRIFRQTSDEFFAQHDLTRLFGGMPLDLAFIDGMHHFEYALRDFMNLERFSNPASTILIHDCLPIDETTADRERSTTIWSGDIWRLILLLRERRPDLEVSVVDSGPTGLGLVRGLDPASSVLRDHYDEIVARYLSLPYRSANGEGARESPQPGCERLGYRPLHIARSTLSAYERRAPKSLSLVLRRAVPGEQGDSPRASPPLSQLHKGWFLYADGSLIGYLFFAASRGS